VRQAHVVAAACTALVYAVELAVARGPAPGAHPTMIAVAITLDLVVVVPLVWWWLVARRSAAPLRTLVPVVAVGALAARTILPESAREAAWLAQGLAVMAELALVAAAIGTARRALGQAHSRRLEQHGAPAGASPTADAPDVAEALEQGLVATLGDRFARARWGRSWPRCTTRSRGRRDRRSATTARRRHATPRMRPWRASPSPGPAR
jgi:hypothetical protein